MGTGFAPLFAVRSSAVFAELYCTAVARQPVFCIHVEVVFDECEHELPYGAVFIPRNRGAMLVVAFDQQVDIRPEELPCSPGCSSLIFLFAYVSMVNKAGLDVAAADEQRAPLQKVDRQLLAEGGQHLRGR